MLEPVSTATRSEDVFVSHYYGEDTTKIAQELIPEEAQETPYVSRTLLSLHLHFLI